MMKNTQNKNTAWKNIRILCPPFLIIILSCGMSLYYLSYNPEHLLIFDDSYITLQFASNFFNYGGITYDGSSYLTGATSPLHIVLIALLGLFLKMETASLAVGIIFFVFSSLLAYLWTLNIYNDRGIALLAGILMATSGWLVFDALNGLETTTFIFCSLLALYCFSAYKEKPFYTIPLFLSILTRPEGWFLAGALWLSEIICYCIHRNKQTLKRLFTALGIFILLIIPYFLISLYYQGSLVPGTAFAKAIFFAEGSMPFINKVGFFKNRFFPFYITLLYPIPLFIFPLLVCARKVIFLPYLWFYVSTFYLFYFLLFPGAIQHYWYRYQHIFIPLCTIALAGGTYELISICKQKLLKIAMAVVILLCIAYNQSVSFGRVKNIYSNQIACVEYTLLDLVHWLKENTPDDCLIALHDIGVVGYFSGRKMLDLVGIVNPEVTGNYLDQRSKTVIPLSERNSIDYLKEKRPDYLVMLPEWDKFFNVLTPGNRNYFELLHVTPPLYPTDMKYQVFKCNWDS